MNWRSSSEKLAERQPDLVGDRGFGREWGCKAQLVKRVGIAERVNGNLFRQGGRSRTDQDNVTLSSETLANLMEVKA